MAIKIDFDAARNPQVPTFILAKKNGDKIGKLNAHAIEITDNLNDASEISFSVYKYIDGEKDPLWDLITNFKLVYCVEWNKWFEATVELDENQGETIKTAFCTLLGQAELSQIMLYDIEINTETDIERDDYVLPTVLYRDDPENQDSSLMHRILKDKAPHYSVIHVDDTIKNMQRTFEFSDTSIYDACQEIAEELNCLFVFNSNSDENGKIQRTISIYDLESNCKSCGYRGEFADVCPECGKTDIDDGYGEDTTIFVTADELAENIQLSTDTDEMKNCFKLEAGDDLMTATIRNCNPNGTDYIWYLSNDMKADMSEELVNRIDEYNQLYADYQNGEIDLDGTLLYEYNELVNKYNDLMNKKDDDRLELIETPIKGFPALIDAYYNTFDLYLYLQSGLMPTIDTARPDINEEIAELTTANLSPVAVNVGTNSTVNQLKALSVSTADNLVLSMAKTLVDSRYKVKIADGSTLSAYSEGVDYRIWGGRFVLTAYSDDEVTATTDIIEVKVNDDYETFVRRKLDKALSAEDAEDMSVSGLFKKDLAVALMTSDGMLLADSDNAVLHVGALQEQSFEAALKEYSLNRLTSFHDACQSCIDIMIEQGVADGNTWGNTESANIYEDLYMPYYNKLAAIEYEMNVRSSEIEKIVGRYNEDGELEVTGLQNAIEKKKAEIQDALDFEKFLGEELWLEFCSFRREDKYSNDNYISDGLNNAELIEKANEFIETAKKEIYKSAELQCSISADLRNLLVIKKFESLVDKFQVGNWLRVMVDDKVYKLRLVSYTIDYDDLTGISVEFSDTVRANSSIKSVQDVLSQASSMATSYSSVQRQAKQGEESKVTVDDWVSSGLDATNVKIMGGADGQSQSWDNHGMLFREYDEQTQSYLPEQMKIVNSTISITDDDWETIKTAVGKFYYIDPRTKEPKVTYGINAETVIGKFILSESMSIQNESGSMVFDGNGLLITSGTESDAGTMTFDENGLIVKHGQNTVTISPKYEEVMNITNGDDKVFEVDENGELSISGNIMARSLRLESGVTIDSGVITNIATVATTGDYADLVNKPTKLSQFTNDSGFITNGVSNLTNYYTKGQTYTRTEVNSLLNDKANTNDLASVATSGKYTDLTGSASNAGKLLYVDNDGSVTTITIASLKTLLGIE